MDIATHSADGHRWITRLWSAPAAKHGLLWLPALGVPAIKYARMAESLAARNISVAVHEWRGNDSSSLRASRRCDWGYRELLAHDFPATLAAANRSAPDLQWSLGGHSLGGQLAVLALALMPESAQGLVLLATGVPDARSFSGARRWAIAGFAHAIDPITHALGYFPGDRLQWAGREAGRLMREWASTVRTGSYAGVGVGEDIESRIGRIVQPVLGMRLSEDWLAPQASLEALLAKLGAGKRRQELFDTQRLGARADHFRWMKSPDAVTQVIADWIGR